MTIHNESLVLHAEAAITHHPAYEDDICTLNHIFYEIISILCSLRHSFWPTLRKQNHLLRS